MNAVVAERGQVTIPKKIRDRLGLTPHTIVDFTEDKGRIIVTKVIGRDAVSRVQGCLRLGRKTDDIVRALRGDA
jgi:AbrB family looped-hinge helix DNA binding protein